MNPLLFSAICPKTCFFENRVQFRKFEKRGEGDAVTFAVALLFPSSLNVLLKIEDKLMICTSKGTFPMMNDRGTRSIAEVI